MAISVRDIQEKEFATQQSGGYNVEQVDDFLDEIAEQMAALVRENLELNQQVNNLKNDVQQAQARTPDYNEKDYFQNLQNAMRESLIGAQRIADETMEEATQKAQKTVDDANAEAERVSAEAKDQASALVSQAQAQADKITAEAKGRVEALEARFDALKTAAKSYKADFSKLIDQQVAALRESNGLF